MHLNTVSCSAVWRAILSRKKLKLTDEQFETAVGVRYWPKALKDGKATPYRSPRVHDDVSAVARV